VRHAAGNRLSHTVARSSWWDNLSPQSAESSFRLWNPQIAQFSGSQSRIGLINCGSEQVGGRLMRNLFRPMALFSAVAVVLSLTAVVTLSRVTLSSGGVGKLKCYDVRGGTEKPC
jgi:hypothetical protein